ncbi:MAG: helix-turn-helix domain-containing protein [Coriobacteriia bacterium]|nr:helix-turn-helix domain-containing protein [Coriobacteriia bacterium]
MELSKRIRELRQREGLSQEGLAECIYVTRQTVSNWETERSYPDVQSLLLLSALFNVSLDELVKGDIEMMKKELDAYKATVWSWIVIVCGGIGIIALIPMYEAFGLLGLLPSLVLIALAAIGTAIVERVKKKHCVETYSEVVAFLEGKPLDEKKAERERAHKGRWDLLKIAGGMLIGIVLCFLGLIISIFIVG